MIDMTKAELRTTARAARRAFAQARGSALFPWDCPSVAAFTSLLAPDRAVAGYIAMGHEADPAMLLDRLYKAQTPLCLPWIGQEATQMTFRAWRPCDQLERASAGFDQPLETAAVRQPEILLIPLLGFDRLGNRLGQGAGHYDRALAKSPDALRIGLGWSCQEFARLPADPWDMPLDAILTEAEWILPTHSRIKT